MVIIPSIYTAHNIPGRLRIKIPLIYKNLDHSKHIKSCLIGLFGIQSVTPSIVTSSVVIIYQPDRMTANQLLNTVNCVLNKRKTINGGLLVNQKYLSDFDSQNCIVPGDIVCGKLGTHPKHGLSHLQANEKFLQFGPNMLVKVQSKPLLKLFLGQFNNFFVKILFSASFVSVLLGDWVDAIFIIIIVLLEATLGVVQENRAEKSLMALSRLSCPQTKVIREGMEQLISSDKLVVGDVVLLELGNSVPADGRILESNGLEVMEGPLTGESSSVLKSSFPLKNSPANPGDMENMLFLGTNITKGKAKMVIVATGMRTQMGKIAQMLQDVETSSTPLQVQLDKLGMFITGGCIICSLAIVGAGFFTGRPLIEMLKLGVALTVGAIPESLSSIVTISMAVGIQRMVKQNAIVRNLPAIETLAHTTVICSDKTGTLTANEMTVKEIFVANCKWEITGEGYAPTGEFISSSPSISSMAREALNMSLTAGVLCNNATLEQLEDVWCIDGDPTEAALLVLAHKYGLLPTNIRAHWAKVEEYPFDAEKMRMTTIHRNNQGSLYLFTKGAADVIIPMCSNWHNQSGIDPLDEITLRHITKANDNMADNTLRILAFAYKEICEEDINKPLENLENDLIFLGLTGMMDPPKPFVKEAIDKCNQSGVKVVMITGDHQNTATAIAKKLDLLKDGKILNGTMLSEMSDDHLLDIIDDIRVFTRTAPDQKLRIVKAFKEKGYIVAMTGDGVNDAPAVKESNVGIAMGKNGTDVTREASSITLADDNFCTIVAAMEEGKTINQNIKKFIRYVLSGNVGEVILLFISAVTSLPMPMNPSQILFVNLATEGLPALALGIDAPPSNVMNLFMNGDSKKIFDKKMKYQIAKRGTLTGLTAFSVFASVYIPTGNLLKSQTIALSSLVGSQMFHALDCRKSDAGSTCANPYLLPSIAISTALLLGSIYIPGFQSIFHTVPLEFWDWLFIIISSGMVSWLDTNIKTPAGFLSPPMPNGSFIPG